jgi:Uma2 family endonuclease
MTMIMPTPSYTPVVLTAAEYEALPANPRLELVDGILHVMTPPSGRHQEIVDRLKQLLSVLAPAELRTVREQELRLGELLRRNPDLMVIRAEALELDRYSSAPDEVVLVVEVVNPGTVTTDRLHKHAEYGAARVAHYWRVEPNPLTVHTYRLGETGFLETGLFVEGDTMNVPGLPWAQIKVSDLAPRI